MPKPSTKSVPMPLSILMGKGIFAPRDDTKSVAEFLRELDSDSGRWISQTRVHKKDDLGQTLLNTISSARILDQFDFGVLLALIEVARQPSSIVKTVFNKKLRSMVYEGGVTLNGVVLGASDSESVCSLDDAIKALSKAVRMKVTASEEDVMDRELEIILHSSLPRAVANIDLSDVARAVFGQDARIQDRHISSIKRSLRKLSRTTVKVMGVTNEDVDAALQKDPKLQTGKILARHDNASYIKDADVSVLEWERVMTTYYNAGLIANAGLNEDGSYRVHFSPALSLHIAIASTDTEAWANLTAMARDSVLSSNMWNHIRINTADLREIPIRNQRLRTVYNDVMLRLTMTRSNRNYTLNSMLMTIYGPEKYMLWSEKRDAGSSILRKQQMMLKTDLLTLYGMENLTELVKKRTEFEAMFAKLKIAIPGKPKTTVRKTTV